MLSFVRWHLLIGAVGISVKLLDTLRLGVLGYALNFVSLGSLGGDLFKAIFLARGQPGRRTEAIATVLADRILGLTTMLLMASAGILASGLLHRAPPSLAALCNTILAAAAIAIVGAMLVLTVPALTGSRVSNWVQQIPILGTTLARLLGAARAYRDEKRILFAAAAMSILSNWAYVTSFFLVASGLPIERPTYSEHFVIVPVANMVGAIPATPNGLGTKEAAVDLLYHTMPSGERIAKGVGTMVTLAHRITEMTVALVGLTYYLSHRKEVSEIYAEAEEAAESA
jgi:glycosyltransferase 2 family protein